MIKPWSEICSDDSGHEYIIPMDKIHRFYEWLEEGDACENAGEFWDETEFDEYRIDGTFKIFAYELDGKVFNHLQSTDA